MYTQYMMNIINQFKIMTNKVNYINVEEAGREMGKNTTVEAMALRRKEAKEKRRERAELWKRDDAKSIAIGERLSRARAISGIREELLAHTKKDELAALRGSIRHWQMDVIRFFKRGNTIEHVYSYQRKQYAYVWKEHNSHYNGHHYQNLLRIEPWDCALCSLYSPYCQDCPLQKVTGDACAYYESVYSRFMDELSLKAAKDMVNALICAYWAMIDDEL